MKRMLLYSALGVLIGGTAYSGQYTERVRKIKDDLQKSIAAKDTATYQKAMDEYVKYVINPVGSKAEKITETNALFTDIITPNTTKLATKDQTTIMDATITSMKKHKDIAALVPDNPAVKINTLTLADGKTIKDLTEQIGVLNEAIATTYKGKKLDAGIETAIKAIDELLKDKDNPKDTDLAVMRYIIQNVVGPQLRDTGDLSKKIAHTTLYNFTKTETLLTEAYDAEKAAMEEVAKAKNPVNKTHLQPITTKLDKAVPYIAKNKLLFDIPAIDNHLTYDSLILKTDFFDKIESYYTNSYKMYLLNADGDAKLVDPTDTTNFPTKGFPKDLFITQDKCTFWQTVILKGTKIEELAKRIKDRKPITFEAIMNAKTAEDIQDDFTKMGWMRHADRYFLDKNRFVKNDNSTVTWEKNESGIALAHAVLYDYVDSVLRYLQTTENIKTK